MERSGSTTFEMVQFDGTTCITFILEHFVLALTIFEILTFEIYDLEKVGQGHVV